jgi:acyl-CoA synthetase (AMP-forming)/AMP-acid ligase II
VSADYQVRVVDPGSERTLPHGNRGELQFRGPNVVDAYLGDEQAAARSFTGDGWFRSGDLGELEEDGCFTYVCRMGDALRLRGFLVEPTEIESRLAAHRAVQATKVVGIPDARGATQAVAFVVPWPGQRADPEDLRTWCAQALAAFKVPAAVHVIEEMPTTSGTNGTKVRTGVLREWARQRQTEQEQESSPRVTS